MLVVRNAEGKVLSFEEVKKIFPIGIHGNPPYDTHIWVDPKLHLAFVFAIYQAKCTIERLIFSGIIPNILGKMDCNTERFAK